MSGLSPALAAQLQEVIDRWSANQAQFSDWLAGTVGGGPNNDGRYPLTNAQGVEVTVASPASIMDMVEGPAAQAQVAKLAAQSAASAAATSASSTEAAKVLAEAAKTAAVAARNLAQTAQSNASNHEANARYWAELAVGKGSEINTMVETVTALSQQVAADAVSAEANAESSAVSAGLAATFEPNNFDLKSDPITANRISGTLSLSNIPVLPSQIQVASAGGLDGLSPAQQAQIGQGSIVTTTDGGRWVYKGSGSKTSSASYIMLADVTPDWNQIVNVPTTFLPSTHSHTYTDINGFTWANLGSKPLTFAPSAHGHAWSEITGVPSSFAPTAHTHDWSEVTGKPSIFASNIANVSGLQGALDGKLETTALTWTNVAGKPSTFAPSAHSHDAADVVSGTLADARIPTLAISKTSGLQSALDAKLASTTASTTYLAKTGNSVRIDNTIAPGQVSIAATAGSAAGFGVYSRSITIGGGFADPSRFWFGVRGTNTDADFGYLSTGTADPYASSNALRIYPTYPAWGTNVIWHAGNDGSGSGLDADLLDGYHAASFAWRSTPASDVAFDSGVSQVLRWKHYGTSHVIIDASNSTAPNGAAINPTNPTVAWTPTYPTLMGWNGSATYGVRVDSARSADILGGLQASSFLRSEAPNPTVSVTATPSSGVKFWDGNDAYSIRMSDVGNGTFGGRVSGDTASDYNMYFRMTGTARGFVFQNNSTAVAGIDGYGNGRFTGDVFAKGTRVPVTTYSQSAPSGGVDGDVHIVW